MSYPFVPVAIVVALSGLMGPAFPMTWALGLVLIGVGIVMYAYVRQRGLYLAALLLLALLPGLSQRNHDVPLGSESLFEVRVAGPVAYRTRERPAQIAEVDLQFVQVGAKWRRVAARTRLVLRRSLPGLGQGVTLRCRLRLERSPRRNPIDPNFYQEADRVRANILSPCVMVARPQWSLLSRLRQVVRDRFSKRLSQQSLGVSKALLLGDKSDLTANERKQWSRSGLAHLLAISGLHVGLFSWASFHLIMLILSRHVVRAVCPARISGLAAMVAAGAFCVWVGAPISAQRAVIFAWIYFQSRRCGDRALGLNTLALAASALLLHEPKQISDVGFQLSFSATASLLLAPRIQRKGAVWALARSAVALIWVQLGTALIVSQTFGELPLVSSLSNLVFIPWMSFVVAPMMVIVLAVDGLWTVQGFELLWNVTHKLVAYAATVPWGFTYVPVLSKFQCSLLALTSAGLLMCAARHRVRWLLILCTVAVCVYLHFKWPSRQAQFVQVTMAYVGQGDGMLLRLPGGKIMLVDAGGAIGLATWDPGEHVMARYLRAWGVSKVDYVIISHPHPDHIGGLKFISSNFKIGELWTNGTGQHSKAMSVIKAHVAKSGGRTVLHHNLPNKIVMGPKTSIEILHPFDKDRRFHSGWDLNDNSIVARLLHGETSILLTGDIEHMAEHHLFGSMKQSQILKVPHHGSRTSSTLELLSAVQPKLAILSCGVRNQFGFPHREVENRYKHLAIPILRTDLDGAISAVSDGRKWEIETFLSQKRIRISSAKH